VGGSKDLIYETVLHNPKIKNASFREN
jgi:hypothetical protein